MKMRLLTFWMLTLLVAGFGYSAENGADSVAGTIVPAAATPTVEEPAVVEAKPATVQDQALADKFAKKKFKKASSVEKDPAGDKTVESPVPQKKDRTLWESFADAQKKLREVLTEKISAMKSGDWGTIWGFLAICFLYGILHALGPGHGKSIVVGYFLARRGSWKQGVALGTGITFIHTFSAVVLLFILYAILKATVFPAFEVGRVGIEKASYALVMLTGLLLMGIALRDFIRRKKDDGEKINTNASWKEILGVAAVTGIVPCPAVALVVLFCLLNSMIALSLVSSVVICMGMMVTNIVFGLLAITMRKGIDQSAHKFGKSAKYVYSAATFVGGMVVLASGLVLFSNTFALQV
jgi:ABC-type nickel/cobalt efflux system permease component RcnA